MSGILAGMRVIEGSAFVAAPLGGMTLAQIRAAVIRFDPPGGGLGYHRWPVTADGHSLFWAGLHRGNRSIVVDSRQPAGRRSAGWWMRAMGSRRQADAALRAAPAVPFLR